VLLPAPTGPVIANRPAGQRPVREVDLERAREAGEVLAADREDLHRAAPLVLDLDAVEQLAERA
jgi:hypothetical protein